MSKNRPSASKSNVATKATFLAQLQQGASVKKAALAAGKNRRTFYDWRDQDAEFRAAWDDAIKESVEILEDEVRARALDRNDKQSYILLMFLLKKHDPSYRENYKREVTVKHEKIQEFDFSQEEVQDAISILEKHANEAHRDQPNTQ